MSQRFKRTITVLFCAAGFVLFTVGCGTNESSAPTTTASPTARPAASGTPPAGTKGMGEIKPGMAGVPK